MVDELENQVAAALLGKKQVAAARLGKGFSRLTVVSEVVRRLRAWGLSDASIRMLMTMQPPASVDAVLHAAEATLAKLERDERVRTGADESLHTSHWKGNRDG